MNNFTCGTADSEKELVTDLSEIQQYLPDGHPDKIVKEADKVIKTDTSRVRITSSEIKVLKF